MFLVLLELCCKLLVFLTLGYVFKVLYVVTVTAGSEVSGQGHAAVFGHPRQ
jgi:hypothetical protein